MGSVSMQSQALSRAERLSAVVDGEAPGGLDQELSHLLSAWTEDDGATWSDYHLLGDALRSDDLLESPVACRAFLERFSARLASEPHLLAPAALAAPSPRRGSVALRRRVLPVFAVAAAAATLTWIVVPQLQGVDNGVHVAALSQHGDSAVQRVAMASLPAATQPESGHLQQVNIIRDVRLDQYLEAHQQFAQQPMVAGAMPLVRAAAVSGGQ
jgi:sigma-E factor negative regulatory protein RseA